MRRWHTFVWAVLIIGILLGLVANNDQGTTINDLQAENAYLQRRLNQSLDQLRTTTDRLLELEQERAMSSRGGRQLTLGTMPLTTPSGYSAARFERAFAGTELAGIGEALVAAEEDTGINALVLAGICAHESGWGASRLAKDKCNLAGLGAYPGAEYSAGITFGSRAGSVMFLAELLAVKYAPGGCYFGGSFDLAGVGVRYATDPGWARKVAGCVRSIAERGDGR